jgi:hypothetical protein
MAEPDPSRILQIGTGFFAAKTLLSAVELGPCTELAKSPMTGQEIASRKRVERRSRLQVELDIHVLAVKATPRRVRPSGLCVPPGSGYREPFIHCLESIVKCNAHAERGDDSCTTELTMAPT